jgi:hypothetical protein
MLVLGDDGEPMRVGGGSTGLNLLQDVRKTLRSDAAFVNAR